MSGIMGLYYRDGRPVDRDDLARMVNILAHRGPDGADRWVEGSVGFGHRMLWTTPESLLEQLPLVKNDLAITADARIDNREDLMAALGWNDRVIQKITDSELILAAYEKWGEQCPEYLLGDFAFAIWDGRQQILFCARDHFGVKPFYYYLSGSTFVFASEIKALFCLPAIPLRMNEIRIGDYLISNFEDTTMTSYQDIRRLPPAHSMVIQAQGVQSRCYWSLDPTRELQLQSDQDYADAFRELLTEAVRCRLRSAFPVGSMLSGGLDSSSITCVARNLLSAQGQNLHTFSVIFEHVIECDERSYIHTVLAQEGLQPHYLQGDQRSLFTDIDQILWHEEEAYNAPGLAITTWGLCDLASAQGVRVLLDGHDGDGVVSHGFGYLHELARQGDWIALARQLRGVSRLYNESFWPGFWTYFRHYGVEPFMSRTALTRRLRWGWQALERRMRRRSQSTNSSWDAYLNPNFVEQIGLEARYRAWRQAQRNVNQTERAEHYRTLTQGLQAFGLEVLNKASSAFPVEQRYPFWDKRLVEFCLSLPPEQKLYQGWSRMVMRRAMNGILPPAIQWRTTKTDFLPNARYGLLAFEQERLQTCIVQDARRLKAYLNLNALTETYNKFMTLRNQATFQDVFPIWQAVSLSLWLRSIEQNDWSGGLRIREAELTQSFEKN